MAGHHRHQRTAVCAQPDLALLSTRVFDLDTAAEIFEHRDSSLDPPLDVAAAARSNATQSMESAYASVVVTRFAAWAYESERAMCGDLVRRGYTLDTSTRAILMALKDIRMPWPELNLSAPEWSEVRAHLRVTTGSASRGKPRRIPSSGRTRRWY
jgi:hypothetical protein